MLDIFALIVLFVLCAVFIWLVVLIGNIPGNIARERSHPQAEAISLLAWIGLFTMGLGWFVALIWSKTNPLCGSRELEQTVQKLEERVQQLEVQS